MIVSPTLPPGRTNSHEAFTDAPVGGTIPRDCSASEVTVSTIWGQRGSRSTTCRENDAAVDRLLSAKLWGYVAHVVVVDVLGADLQ